MTIYEIEQSIMDCVDEDGEIIDIAKFDELQMVMELKIDNLACYYKHLLSEAEAIKMEKNKLGERQKNKENQAERVKEYLSNLLCGRKFETARNKISWRRCERVNITSEDFIPKEFIKVVETRTPMKEEIKKAIKNGALIPGAELIEKKQYSD